MRGASGRGQLTAKEEHVVSQYLRDDNATRAAVAAGYSVKTAAQAGYKLVHTSSGSEAIERGRSRLLQRAEMKTQDLVDRLVVLASADMADIDEWDGESGRIKPFSEGDTRPILEFSATRTTTLTQDGAQIISEQARVKIINPLHAAKQLAELLSIGPKERGIGGSEISVKAYTQEDWDRIPS